MHLLSCPDCQAEITVTPAQAGDQVPCPKCHQNVAIPKLGDLRQLPTRDQVQPASPAAGRNVGGTIAFVALSLIAVAALLAAGYGGVRWAAIQPEMSLDEHLESIETTYDEAAAASMLLEFEDMEKNSLDLVMPYPYQVATDEKSGWARSSLIALAIAVAGGVAAGVAATRGRKEV